MADGKINRPYGGVLLLGIFLTPLLSLGHDYADGIITAKYFRFAEVVGIGLLLTWMVAWKRNSILFQMGGCRCGAVRFVWGGKFFVE